MINTLKIIITFLIPFVFNPVFCQNSANYDRDITTCEVIDTIKTEKYFLTINALWLKDTIILMKFIKPTAIDSGFFRTVRKDSKYIPTEKEITEYNEFLYNAAQNCHSYALEKYFENNNFKDNCLFNKETVIHSDSYKKILSASFYKIQDFNVIKRKNSLPKQNIENNTLIVFYNHYEMIIHSVFLKNGVFYTKDGLQPPREETNIFGIIRHYWDTKRIEVYKHSDDS